MSDGSMINAFGHPASRFGGAMGRSGLGNATPNTPSFSDSMGRIGRTIENFSGLPLVFDGTAPIVSAPFRPISLVVKRIMDIVLSLGLLLLLAPMLLGVALAVKATSRGPVLFRQVRDGLTRQPICIYKFRTMYCDRCDLTGIAQTVDGDTRVTPIGRILRRTNIDELPQLLNVLKGGMSLIGPRPHPIGMLGGGIPYEELVPYYHWRHIMKPGLSGWAQANGYRGPTHDPRLARARIGHDLAYIVNFSLWLDLKTMARTVVHEIAGGSGS